MEMAQDREPHIWSCSANGNVYYSTLSNPDWQNICVGMSSISAGHCGIVCAIDSEGVINIRVGISDSKPYGLDWTSLLCEAKRVVVGSRKVVRITKENKIFVANLPTVIDRYVYLSWYVVIIKDSISESNLLSLDVNDNLYIASKSGDIFVYVENQSAREQSFWKLIITGPKVPKGLLSKLKSFASLGLLSDENSNNVDVCSFLVGEKFMWLIRKNSKEIYQLEFDSSVDEQVNTWNRFRLNNKWTIDIICGCKDSMIWAITDDSKLVTITCTLKGVSVEECFMPLLTAENCTKFCWASASVGYTRQLPSQLLQENLTVPTGNTRMPPSTLSLYPTLPEHEFEATSNGSEQHGRECCDDGSCHFCMDQKQRTMDDSLSPVQASLQKKGYIISSSYSPGLQLGIKRKADYNNSDPICNERIILKAKRRRKNKSQLPKLKLLEGIKMSLSPKLKKANHYSLMYNPLTLQAANYSTFKAHEKLFDFNLEEECLSGEEPLAMSIPCSEDSEVIMLSSNSSEDDNNNTEAFEFSVATSKSQPSGPSTVATCTSVTVPMGTATENLVYPTQATASEEFYVQPKETSVQPSSLSISEMASIPSAAPAATVPVAPPPPPPPPLPPPPLFPSQNPLQVHSTHNPEQNVMSLTKPPDICESEEVGFKADSSSDEEMGEPVQETIHLVQEAIPVQETLSLY